MSKKSQGGIEFLIISGVVIFFFTIFFIAIQSSTQERNREKEALVIKNLALRVQDEISLATEASDGYMREFSMPNLVSGKDYRLEVIDNNIYIETERNAISLRLDNVTGEIQTGANIIKKENGRVYLNQ